ncbi:hypothetical protein CB0940_08524 [Cercospora beticola]|uniref:Peroxin 26 n=1 Tax=Cercospora beticola TaxID=122368 RepID=A0A2G5HNS8_CERBT|nr:hypothetical protein CB0940_08524 [Cercospora beticola]PIA94205.1 hypothetical protein CB0940_08524 [Cercospora beticola]WPB05101.1 hypothetical protein RHO25_009751 [Cercospora beticola]CAK1364885.1 unnamed protein product [Cercospora beticola]
MASAGTVTYQDALNSQYLSSSISSLSRSRSANTLIVRTYKQATQLYLTKRFKEALETLEPIVTSQQPGESDVLGTNGVHSESPGDGAALVAQSSKGTRTKVWVFYLSLLHAIIELGAEDGKNQFGSTKWRQLAAKARDGTVWDEIIRLGYGGNEGDVDPDVVVNLATLLLGHMQNQKLNQQRIEAYLSASADAAQLAYLNEGIATPMSNGTSSPKELTTRLKILELYSLHVLPANEEWEYAQQFIEMSDMLDEERREAFLHALASLKDEKDGTAQRERELEELRERELEEQRAAEEAQRKENERREEERKRAAELERSRTNTSNASSSSRPTNGHVKNGNGAASASRNTSHATAKPPSKPQKKTRAPPPNLYMRASTVFSNLQQMVLEASRGITGNSTALFRLMMFLVAFLLIMARRDLRMKLKRAIDDGWMKVKQTIGMGTKVSYI